MMAYDYFSEYREELDFALKSMDRHDYERVAAMLAFCHQRRHPILMCGNGGSAATAEHFSCDHTKGIVTDVPQASFVISLASNVSLCTAIANDIGYDEIFSKQIEWFSNNHAAVVTISASGNSPNIINAIKAARKRQYASIALVGFDGGKVKRENLADLILHVPSTNYGIVEDAHSMIMHSLAQHYRTTHTRKSKNELKL